MRNRLFNILIIISVIFSAFAHYFIPGATIRFISASLVIILLATLLGKATETVAYYAGDRIGGFLNATFGNAAELIISIILIKKGMFDIVKASITGSIIGNLLLVLGLSLFVGGLKFKQQSYNPLLACHNASLMLLSVIALFIPAAFAQDLEIRQVHIFSLIIAGCLMLTYILWIIFSMITHKEELQNLEEDHPQQENPLWSMKKAITIMSIATILVAIASDWLVQSVEVLAFELGWSELFIGAFIIAIVGNAAEHSAAVLLAFKNRIGASVEIAIGSSLQIALFIGPLVVFLSHLFKGPSMDIIFSTYELIAIGVAVFITMSISQDGKTNWFEGVLLLLVYTIIGTAFFFA